MDASISRSEILIRIALWVSIPAIFGEAIQHIIEFHFGMYRLGDGIAAGFESNVRMIGAAAKVAGVLCTIMLARTQRRALDPDRPFSPTTRFLAIALPLVAHYALNYAAVGKPDWIVIALITIDCFVIGAIATAIGLFLPNRIMAKRR